MGSTRVMLTERCEDINSYLSALEELDSDSLHTPTSWNTPRMHRMMKSTFILLLYNMIEATAVGGIREIYEHLLQNRVTLGDLRHELQRRWLISRMKPVHSPGMSIEKLVDHAKKLFAEFYGDEVAAFDLKHDVYRFGNMDAKAIQRTYAEHGINLPFKDEHNTTLGKVKGMRNKLAHGNASFDECCRQYSLKDLREMRDNVIESLNLIVDAVEEYLQNQEYLGKP